MRFFSIIPDQISHQFCIEGIKVVQVIDVPADEPVLNSLIESFQVGVGLRVFRVIEEMDEAVLTTELIEVFMEFAAVIGLDSSGREGSTVMNLLRKSLPLAEEFDL